MEKFYLFLEEEKKEEKTKKVRMLNLFEIISSFEELREKYSSIENIIDLTDEQILIKKIKEKNEGELKEGFYEVKDKKIYFINNIKAVFMEENVFKNLKEEERKNIINIKKDFISFFNDIVTSSINKKTTEIEIIKQESLKINLKNDINFFEELIILKDLIPILKKIQKF